jgi:hypothetical protein
MTFIFQTYIFLTGTRNPATLYKTAQYREGFREKSHHVKYKCKISLGKVEYIEHFDFLMQDIAKYS